MNDSKIQLRDRAGQWIADTAAYQTKDIKHLVEKAKILAHRDEPVFIEGETGVGKELFAKILHGTRNGPFVACNITAVTDTLFESELFGHVKGAFTGAIADRKGLAALASGGTLFLDEIGDMPPALQAKILRLVQFRTYRKVGGDTEESTNCRIISATCQGPNELRADLFYRLSPFHIKIPPLRERPNDILQFIDNQSDLTDAAKTLLKDRLYTPPVKKITETRVIHKKQTIARLNGNYRQLERIVLRYKVLKELPPEL